MEKYYRAGQATDDNIMRRMHVAWRIQKTTNTYLEYEILIAFPQQQWLHERAPLLRYACIACLVTLKMCDCSHGWFNRTNCSHGWFNRTNTAGCCTYGEV